MKTIHANWAASDEFESLNLLFADNEHLFTIDFADKWNHYYEGR